MKNVPLIIVGLLVTIAVAAGWYVATSEVLCLKGPILVNAEIAIVASLGAAISATLVIYSYLRTNEAFVESRRPQLLLQVHNLHANVQDQPNQTIPMTRVFYRNITTNMFKDLTINVSVTTQNRTVSLNDLFTSNMMMVGTDERQRNFNTFQELGNRGLEIPNIAQQGNDVILDIGYSYTFNKEFDDIQVNSYRWDPASMEWHIA